MFDVSGLSKITMKVHNGWQGCYFLDRNRKIVAKTCNRCRNILPSTSFTKGNSVGGLQSTCRECRVEYSKSLADRGLEEVLSQRNALHPDGTKKCYACKHLLPLSMFSVCKQRLDGLQSKCSTCQASYSREYGITVDGRGVSNYQKSSQRYTDAQKHRTPEEVLIDRRKLHPDGLKNCSRCDHRKPFSDFYTSMSEPDGLTYTCIDCQKAKKYDRDRKKLIDYWEKNSIPLVCYICDGPWEHADHVIAFSRGGADSPDNRLPICRPCNSSKWKHPLGFWLLRAYPEKMEKIIHKVTVVYGMSI